MADSGKPIVPRALTNQDVETQIANYLDQGTVQAALGFVAALERAYTHISRHPATGSPRYAHELGIPGLRCWPLTHYPRLIFYIDQPQHIDVWRVLHAHRNIPAWMQNESES